MAIGKQWKNSTLFGFVQQFDFVCSFYFCYVNERVWEREWNAPNKCQNLFPKIKSELNSWEKYIASDRRPTINLVSDRKKKNTKWRNTIKNHNSKRGQDLNHWAHFTDEKYWCTNTTYEYRWVSGRRLLVAGRSINNLTSSSIDSKFRTKSNECVHVKHSVFILYDITSDFTINASLTYDQFVNNQNLTKRNKKKRMTHSIIIQKWTKQKMNIKKMPFGKLTIHINIQHMIMFHMVYFRKEWKK